VGNGACGKGHARITQAANHSFKRTGPTGLPLNANVRPHESTLNGLSPQKEAKVMPPLRTLLLVQAILIAVTSSAIAAEATLTPADRAAAFKTAGFKLKGKKWIACAEGQIGEVRDVNGDGLPEAIINESGSECHGNTGEGYSLVSKQPNGSWKLLSQGTGILEFLKGPRVSGWPDIQVGGPGFCFPVYRWNGHQYVFNRNEYEGKRCKR